MCGKCGGGGTEREGEGSKLASVDWRRTRVTMWKVTNLKEKLDSTFWFVWSLVDIVYHNVHVGKATLMIHTSFLAAVSLQNVWHKQLKFAFLTIIT